MVGSIAIVIFFIGGVLSQAPSAVITPTEGYIASLGSTTTFNCTVTGTTHIFWFVDGTSNSADHLARGITRLTDLEEQDGTIISRLQVSATVENDGIELQCIAFQLGQPDGESSIATFRVQGLLDPPNILGITDQGSGMQALSWEAPSTLDITDMDPDISYYNVCSTLLSEVTCRSVQSLQYEFVSVRIEIVFTVAAVNVVGEGAASIVTYTPCNPGTAPTQIDANMVITDVSLQSAGTTPSVSFSFDRGNSDCFDLYRIQALPSNQGTPVRLGPVIPTVSPTSLTLSLESGLTRSTIYSANLTSLNVNGDADSTGQITFSTYDIQSVEASARAGAIAVECSFTSGSTVTNCAVRVCEVEVGMVTEFCQPLVIPRPPSSLRAIQELPISQPGSYMITEVSIRNEDSSTVTFAPQDMGYLSLQTVEVTMTPPPTTAAPPTVSVGPSDRVVSQPPVGVGVIAGSVIGVVVVIAILLVLLLVLLMYIHKQRDSHSGKSESTRLTNTEMWLDDIDGGSTKRLTTPGDPSPPNLSPGFALGQQPSSPLSDMAVIQGRNGCHVEIDLNEGGSPEMMELNSVELTEPVEVTKVKSSPSPPPYDSMVPAQPNILQHRGPVAKAPAGRPLSGPGNIDRLAPEEMQEIKVAASLDNLSRDNNTGRMRSHSADLITVRSVDSLGSQGQYAEIEHQRRAKKYKKPKENDMVLYSEIKVDELRPVVPQKKRSKASYSSSLNNDPRIETYHV